MTFKPSHVVAVVASVALAAVLVPVGVNAATGTLVNIADKYSADRVARVSSANTLLTETRAGSSTYSFNGTGQRLGLGWANLASATAPTKLVITELSFAARGPVSDTAQEVLIEAMVRTSGSNGCTGPGTAGYTRHTLRRVLVKNQTSTMQMLFNGPPLVAPVGADGQPTCFGFTVVTVPSGSAMDVGVIGYRSPV